MAAKIFRWAIFTVLFSLLPIVASYVIAVAKKDGTFVPLGSVIEHGELYLLSSSFAAVGLGEVIGVNESWKISKIIVAGFSLLNVGLSSILFATASNMAGNANAVLEAFSYPIFFFSFIVGTACIALSEAKHG